MAKPHNTYIQTKFRTASPEELTIMTFDILINSTTTAIEKLRSPVLDIQGIHKDLRRAQKAAALLMGSIRFEIDPGLAKDIFRIYEYWHHELFLANMRKSSDLIEQLLPQMKQYRETWVEANRRYRLEKQNQTPTEAGGFLAAG